MKGAHSLRQTKQAVLAEIQRISNKLGSEPAFIEWPDGVIDDLQTVIASWGDARVRAISDEGRELLSEGKSPKAGVLIDSLGNIKKSSSNWSASIYKIVGGDGYVFAASFGAQARGHQQHVIIKPTGFLSDVYAERLGDVLSKDAALPPDDFRYWPAVAFLTRDLSIDTSPEFANETLDDVFAKFRSKKLWSHVWSVLPGSTILGLSKGIHRNVDIYGPKTQFPEIRRNLRTFLSKDSADPFIDFAHYAVGQFEQAQKSNPQSLIRNVTDYALGFRRLSVLIQEAFELVQSNDPFVSDYEGMGFASKLSEINASSFLKNNKRLGPLIDGFSTRADQSRPFFKAVITDKHSLHADDAAYMLGWLALHEGRDSVARSFFSKSLVYGLVDYGGGYPPSNDYGSSGGIPRVVYLNQYLPAQTQAQILREDANFSKVPVFWYVAARKAYQNHEYLMASEISREALNKLNIDIHNVPATTDSQKIDETMSRILKPWRDRLHIGETIYILNASRELNEFKKFLNDLNNNKIEFNINIMKKIIKKYSKIKDSYEEQDKIKEAGYHHKDLRQSIYIIELSLDKTKDVTGYDEFRQWLHYRKIRLLANFRPKLVGGAIEEMEAQYPKSQLLDDAWAERVYAEGIELKNTDAMLMSLEKLKTKYPDGNAVDNAHSWAAIALRCAKKYKKAEEINKYIIREFPLTRHAIYAIERLRNPRRCTHYS